MNRDVLAIGTSAGGVEALLHLAKAFRPGFPASVLVTIHLSPHFRSSLDELMNRAGPLRASFATEGEPLRRGRIYLAPPDRHLLVHDDRLWLSSGPRENNSRPAIDAMLRSVALCCCGRAIGVVLTGTLGDGASGLWAVSQCGGITVIQDPSRAQFPEMPENALNLSQPDHLVDLEQLPRLLESLVHQPARTSAPVPAEIRAEVEIARQGAADLNTMDRFAERSFLACPDCHGVMWEINEGGLVRFRCHVGHAYTGELMSLALDESLRSALGTAQRALEERVALTRRLLKQAKDRGQRNLSDTWAAKLRECERELSVIRSSLARVDALASSQQQQFG